MLADDGAQFEYNPDTGVLSVLGVTKINIAASGDTVVYSGGNVTAKVGGNVTATVGGNLNATVSGSTLLKSGGNTTITAPLIILDGPVQCNQTLDVKGVSTLEVGGTDSQRTSHQRRRRGRWSVAGVIIR